MAYTIKYTNGKILATIADQSYDNISTSLTIVGKNSSAYGDSLNTNFIHLLENFANITAPRSPIAGQLWYNTVAGRMYVYTTSSFKPVGGPTISPTQPAGLVAGELWIDSTAKQLKWFDGSAVYSSGKDYSDVTGKAGWVSETVTDLDLADKMISSLYNNGTLIGVISEADIALNTPYCGTTTIRKGFTLNSISGIRFVGTATSADSVAGFDPTSFVKRNDSSNLGNVMSVLLYVNTSSGVVVGTQNNLQLHVNTLTNAALISSNLSNQKMHLQANGSAGLVSLITLNGATYRVGINNENPTYNLDVVGDMRVSGNLTIIGTSTTITSTDLAIQDKNIILGVGNTTDLMANGGGITLVGASNHVIIYNNGLQAWETTDNLHLYGSDPSYMINNLSVINQNSLGTGISSAPGLKTIQGDGTGIDKIKFADFGTGIGAISGMTFTTNTIVTSNLDNLILNPGGAVDLNNNNIINLKAPVDDLDAASKKYVDDELVVRGFTYRKPYTISMDVTNFLNVNQDIKDYLDKLLPIDGGAAGVLYSQPDSAVCTVLATTYAASSSTFVLDLNSSFINVDKDAVLSAEEVLKGVAGSVIVTTPMPIPTHQVKLYQVSTGTWTFIGDIS